MENNKLVVQNQNILLPKVGNLLEITNKLLSLDDRQFVLEIFKKNPKLFVDLISHYYPISYNGINKYSDYLCFSFLSLNKSIKWTNELIYKYEKKFSWKYGLSTNESLPWSIDFLNIFYSNYNRNDEYRLNDCNFTILECLPWKEIYEVLINQKLEWRKYPNNIKFTTLLHRLSGVNNPAFPWTLELIEKYLEKLNWGKNGISKNESVNFPWSINFIEKYKDKLEWIQFGLSDNKALPWTIELIDKFIDKWSWSSLSSNESIPWSMELITRYQDKLHFDNLSRNRAVPWSEALIEKYEKKLCFRELSSNNSVPWSIELIEKYSTKWRWGGPLSSSLNWSNELFDRYHQRWPLGELSRNNSFPWTNEFIEKNTNKLDWDYLSSNKSLPWSKELIEKYKDKWCWSKLSENKSIPWTIDLIHKYAEKLSKSFNIWLALEKNIDDNLIEEVINNLNK